MFVAINKQIYSSNQDVITCVIHNKMAILTVMPLLIWSSAACAGRAYKYSRALAEVTNSYRSPANQVPKPSKCRPGSHCCHRPILISSKHTEGKKKSSAEEMGSMGPAAGKPHAVCLPYPAQGHITPMLNVAELLHARGFHVTFVNTEYNHARLVRARGAAAVAGVPGFRFDTIPDGLPLSDDDVTQDVVSLCKSLTETCLGPFRRLLVDLNAGGPPVTCVVSDVVMGFSMEAANELGLPYVQLWTASAISYLGYRHYRLLIGRGLAPLEGTSVRAVFVLLL